MTRSDGQRNTKWWVAAVLVPIVVALIGKESCNGSETSTRDARPAVRELLGVPESSWLPFQHSTIIIVPAGAEIHVHATSNAGNTQRLQIKAQGRTLLDAKGQGHGNQLRDLPSGPLKIGGETATELTVVTTVYPGQGPEKGLEARWRWRYIADPSEVVIEVEGNEEGPVFGSGTDLRASLRFTWPVD